MYRFEKLRVWQKAMDFCESVYAESRAFPKEELYGLTSQLRRAATSIPLNIAEGAGSKTRKEFIQFLFVALRSQYEVVTTLRLARRLRYLQDASSDKLEVAVAEVGKLTQALINALQRGRSGPNNEQPTTNN